MTPGFRETLLSCARHYLGVREVYKNSGPLIDEWLAQVGQKPGAPWCVAFTHAMYGEAAAMEGLDNPHPRTAGSHRLYELAAPECRQAMPAPGDVFVLDHGHGLGHVGIVETVTPDGTVTSIEGNSNEEGSREGTSVVRHTWNPRDGKRGAVLGWLDFTAKIGAQNA